MGVAKAWEAFDIVTYDTIQLWSDNFFRQHGRCARVAVDMPQWVFMVLTTGQKSGGGREHRSLMERLLTFMACGVDVVAVFDGMAPLPKLRHGEFAREGIDQSPMVVYAKRIVRALGLPCVDSPSEGEAQCVHLQSQGQVDFVFSSDADILGYGATNILFFNTTTDSDSKVVRQVQNDLPGNVYGMKALLQGNDYHAGVPGLGPKTAEQISALHTGFAQDLEDIFVNHDNGDHQVLLEQWRDRVSHELRTNASGFLERRFLKGLPSDFPCPEVAEALLHPPVKSFGKLEWKRPNWKQLEELWMEPSPIPVSESVVEELKARIDQRSPEARRQIQLDKFRDRVSAPALVDAIRNKYDNPRWYGEITTRGQKKPVGDVVEVPLKPLCPWRHKSGSVSILSCLVRLSKNHTLFFKRDQRITSFFQSVKRTAPEQAGGAVPAKRTKSDISGTCTAQKPSLKSFKGMKPSFRPGLQSGLQPGLKSGLQAGPKLGQKPGLRATKSESLGAVRLGAVRSSSLTLDVASSDASSVDTLGLPSSSISPLSSISSLNSSPTRSRRVYYITSSPAEP